MKYTRSLLLGALVLVAGCGGPGGSADGGSDVAGGACTAGAKPWSASSARFTLHVAGGLPQGAVDGGCGFHDETFTYDPSTGTLGRSGCYSHSSVSDSVVLNAAARTALATRLSDLTTVCPENACGADLPDVTLTVVDGSGASASYHTDFYADCQGSLRTSPPYLGHTVLGELMADLSTTIASCTGETRGTGGVNRCAP